MIFLVGSVLMLETGCYSDHITHGPFKVLKDIDQVEVSKLFIADQEKEEDFDPEWIDKYAMISWLSNNGYISDMENVGSWYLGSYNFEPVKE